MYLTIWHSEWPKLYGVLAILSAVGLSISWYAMHIIADAMSDENYITKKDISDNNFILSSFYSESRLSYYI